MSRVRLEGVHKTYANGFEAVKGVDLAIADGELMVLVGPSGCGKSTLLRLIAGLETPTRGRIHIDDRDVTDVRVQERDVAMVFQNYALYPHKTVRQNLAFALELRRTPRPEIEGRVSKTASALGLEALLDRKPAELSGGQRQRVALGRAIVRAPKAFLFDEPLSNLDATLRVQTRAELVRLHRQLAATMIYVTHDQEEAMTLGDRIAVLHEGRLQQCGRPLDVYRAPASVFVAGFVGSPAMNFIDGTMTRVDSACYVRSQDLSRDIEIALGPDVASREIRLGVRPEDVETVRADEADLVATVDVVERLGAKVLVHLRCGCRVLLDAEASIADDEAVGLRFRRDRLHLFDRATGVRLN